MGHDERALGENTTVVQASQLSYTFPDGTQGLSNVSFALPARSRCLLVGGKQHISSVVEGIGCVADRNSSKWCR